MTSQMIEINGKHYNLDALTYDDIECRYGTGRDQVTGTGRNKCHQYRIGIMTKLGDIEKEEWKKVVYAMIIRDGESELFDALKYWLRRNNRWLKTEEEIESFTLNQFSSRIFDNELWVSFIPFNKRFRPHILSATNIVTVETVCGHRGEVTRSQIDQEAGKGENARICCPECGRYVSFSVV